MSSQSTIVFFGLQLEIPATEVELLELKRHPLLVKARTASLQYYWADFGESEPQYSLIVGKKLAIIGIENDFDATFSQEEMNAIVAETVTKLRVSGFSDEPKFILKMSQP